MFVDFSSHSDVLTDELAQIHRSPGFLSSVLNGINDDGTLIKEFEASHGTVTDMWKAHLQGKETSLNPLSMMEALIGAMRHSAKLVGGHEEISDFAARLQRAIHTQMTSGHATRDLDKNGLTTEEFVDAVRERLEGRAPSVDPRSKSVEPNVDAQPVDVIAMKKLFDTMDINGDGTICFEEFLAAMKKLGITPRKHLSSSEQQSENKTEREKL